MTGKEHIKIDTKNKQFVCLHCGATRPMIKNLEYLIKIMREFAALHGLCGWKK